MLRAAYDAGYREFVLVATLPGEPSYAALGFEVVARDAVPIPDHAGVLEVAHMRRRIELVECNRSAHHVHRDQRVEPSTLCRDANG